MVSTFRFGSTFVHHLTESNFFHAFPRRIIQLYTWDSTTGKFYLVAWRLVQTRDYPLNVGELAGRVGPADSGKAGVTDLSAAKFPTQRIEDVLKMKKVTKPLLLILAGRRGLSIENAVNGPSGLKVEPLRMALTNDLGLAHTPVGEWCQSIREKLSSGEAAV